MNILAIGTSNNTQSINRTLASYAASLVPGASVDTVHPGIYEMPLFSEEREQELGQLPQAQAFLQKIAGADAIVMSFAEHNGSYTAAYKNLFDWTSRIDRKVFQDKPAVFLSTSPGSGGAANVLAAAVDSASYFGADLVASVSVPSFQKNFDGKTGTMTNPAIREELLRAMRYLHNKAAARQS